MTLIRQKKPFDDPEWIFEEKHDGFRALAYVEDGKCKLVSRNSNTFTRFRELSKSLGSYFAGRNAIIDGEIVCLDQNGRSLFYYLMFGPAKQYFYAFDLLYLDDTDLTNRRLIERKSRLKELIPREPSRLLYVEHVEERGVELFEKVCEWDLEGIVAKPIQSFYKTKRRSNWIKIKNPSYSQAEGRQELFEHMRGK